MPDSNADLSKLTELDWLVTARNQIQSFMLELYNEAPQIESGVLDRDRLRKWNLFLGAAFSLWRAVFLVVPEDVERKTEELAQHANAFLKRVIEANAITFGDDLRERQWSSGYYLNNARDRTRSLLKDLLPTIQLTEHISDAILKVVWNETFFGLRNAFEKFKSN